MKYRDLGYLIYKQAARLGPGQDSSAMFGGTTKAMKPVMRTDTPLLKPRTRIPTSRQARHVAYCCSLAQLFKSA